MKGGITHGQYKDHTVKNSLGVNALRLLLCLSETAGGRIHAKRLVAASPDISLCPGLEWMMSRATGYLFLSYFRWHLRTKDAGEVSYPPGIEHVCIVYFGQLRRGKDLDRP